MNRGRKVVRRCGTSKQSRMNNAAKTIPITRSRSNLSQEDRHEGIDEKFVLIELSSNKKLLVNSFTNLLHLNEKEKIKIGSNIVLKMNDKQSAFGTVFLIGSKRQCFDELNIITSQRENESISNIDDDNDEPLLMITSVPTESVQKKSFEYGKSNSSEVTESGMSMDDLPDNSNNLTSSHALSSTTTPNHNRSMLTNHSQNVPPAKSSLKSSIELLPTSPQSSRPSSSNEHALKTTTTNSQYARLDPMARLVLKLEEMTDDCNKWKNKYESLEKKYSALENASMMIPVDENVCQWISTVYDAIQRKTNFEVDFDEESTTLGISAEMLRFYVNRQKPATITARKLFQHMCVEDLSNGVPWSNIPKHKIEAIHAFGEKVFGLIRWNRNTVKTSLQNLVRGERANMNNHQVQGGLQGQNPPGGPLAVDEQAIDDME